MKPLKCVATLSFCQAFPIPYSIGIGTTPVVVDAFSLARAV